MTGAPLPVGADTVVQVEHTEERDGRVFVRRAPAVGRNVRGAGDDVRRGDVVLPRGAPIGPRRARPAHLDRRRRAVGRAPPAGRRSRHRQRAGAARTSRWARADPQLQLVHGLGSGARRRRRAGAAGHRPRRPRGDAPPDRARARRGRRHHLGRRLGRRLRLRQGDRGGARRGAPLLGRRHQARQAGRLRRARRAARVRRARQPGRRHGLLRALHPARAARHAGSPRHLAAVAHGRRRRAGDGAPRTGSRCAAACWRHDERGDWRFTTTGPQGSGILRSMVLADGSGLRALTARRRARPAIPISSCCSKAPAASGRRSRPTSAAAASALQAPPATSA